jgi:hypothetical protein
MPLRPPARQTSIAPWRVFVAVLAAPAAWTLQVCIAEALVAQSCFPYDAPMRASYAGPALLAVIVVSGAALLVGIAGTLFSWHYWRRLKGASVGPPQSVERNRLNGQSFVARVGFMSSAVFLFALVATDIASGMISHCG